VTKPSTSTVTFDHFVYTIRVRVIPCGNQWVTATYDAAEERMRRLNRIANGWRPTPVDTSGAMP